MHEDLKVVFFLRIYLFAYVQMLELLPHIILGQKIMEEIIIKKNDNIEQLKINILIFTFQYGELWII